MSACTFSAPLGGAVIVMLLGGCANVMDDRSGESGPRSVSFRCDDDRGFLALVSEDRRQAFVETGDETYQLTLVNRDDDELTYANNDDVQLTVEGSDAYLRVPGDDDFKDCRAA